MFRVLLVLLALTGFAATAHAGSGGDAGAVPASPGATPVPAPAANPGAGPGAGAYVDPGANAYADPYIKPGAATGQGQTTGSDTASGSAPACQDNPALLPLPPAFIPQVRVLFNLPRAPGGWITRTTVIRCMGGKLWACSYGANLPCGRANTSLSLPGGDAWCRKNPDADFIPAYITGHDSSTQWRCAGGAPTPTGPQANLDAQGFLSADWKALD